MANLSKAFGVLSRACDRLARMGVVDVHSRISARILPPEKCGAEDRALELAREAIAELHARGLEVLAASLSAELDLEPLPSARLAGSTVIEPDFLSPPPIARAIGAAVLAAAGSIPPGSPVPEVPVPPVAPEAPVPPASHEVSFGEVVLGDRLPIGTAVGLDLASEPDRTEVVRMSGYAPGELEALDREIAAEAARGRDQAEHLADEVDGPPSAPVAGVDLSKGEPVAVDGGVAMPASGLEPTGPVLRIEDPASPVPPTQAELDAEALRREAARTGDDAPAAP